jgi:electron transport complex protein RnfB
MHTVITSECTGCELCIAPCPVDCIVMKPLPTPPDEEQPFIKNQKKAHAQQAKRRFDARCLRKEREIMEKAERTKQKRAQLLRIQSEMAHQQ